MFYPVALRVLREGCTGAKKLTPNIFYYFVRGFDIDDDKITCDGTRIEDVLYNIVMNEGNDSGPDITFSAIVGENGSGKSTLVELYIRIINNMGASLLGEIATRQGMPHLHYIDGIYAELYFFWYTGQEATLLRLSVQGRNVEIMRFSPRNHHNDQYPVFISDVTPIFDNEDSIDTDLKSVVPITRYIPPKGEPEASEILGLLAYSYISNFSIYAYNPADFSAEATPSTYERNCRKTGSIPLKFSERHWLEGLFHRRESYQTPIVLYPARSHGDINITKERQLAYSRLISVILSDKSRFRKINDHLEICGITISGNNVPYDVKYIRQKTGYHFNRNGYVKLRKDIISLWDGIIESPDGKKLEDFAKERMFGEDALDYLVYKTLKTSSTYPIYTRYFFSKYEHAVSSYKKDDLDNLVSALAKDVSHVTRKIRQTLFYLRYGLYDVAHIGDTIPIEDISKECNSLFKELPGPEKDRWLLCLRRFGIEDFTPPPFLTATLEIVDKPTGHRVNFNSLSSGEKQFIYSITGIIYHLINLDSVEASSARVTIYNNVIVILEEIELYFHPDLQRKLVRALTEGIRQCVFHHLRNINVMMVTHSPFILSDIPSRNVLALDKDGKPVNHEKIDIRTFGANIHDILKHPFFLKHGAVGELAKRTIDCIVSQLDEARNGVRNDRQKNRLKRLIGLVDEPIISKVLQDDYCSIYGNGLSKEEKIRRKIEELTKKLKEMEGGQQ